jgi:hypothetical protein
VWLLLLLLHVRRASRRLPLLHIAAAAAQDIQLPHHGRDGPLHLHLRLLLLLHIVVLLRSQVVQRLLLFWT